MGTKRTAGVEASNPKSTKKRKSIHGNSNSNNNNNNNNNNYNNNSNGVDSNWKQLQATLKKRYIRRRPSLKEDSEGASEHAETENSNQQVSNVPARKEDTSVTKVLAMDCEMVGVGFEGKKNALARVSLVNFHGHVIYDKYVRPLELVTDLRTEVSGIRPRNLKKAEYFTVVQEDVSKLLNGRILVGHALHNDLKVLQLSHPRKDTRDTSLFGPICSYNGRPRALRHLAAEYLGTNIQDGEHDSIEDARAAMLLYQRFRKDWEHSLQHKKSSKQGAPSR